jgi:hypothetical protein
MYISDPHFFVAAAAKLPASAFDPVTLALAENESKQSEFTIHTDEFLGSVRVYGKQKSQIANNFRQAINSLYIFYSDKPDDTYVRCDQIEKYFPGAVQKNKISSEELKNAAIGIIREIANIKYKFNTKIPEENVSSLFGKKTATDSLRNDVINFENAARFAPDRKSYDAVISAFKSKLTQASLSKSPALASSKAELEVFHAFKNILDATSFSKQLEIYNTLTTQLEAYDKEVNGELDKLYQRDNFVLRYNKYKESLESAFQNMQTTLKWLE